MNKKNFLFLGLMLSVSGISIAMDSAQDKFHQAILKDSPEEMKQTLLSLINQGKDSKDEKTSLYALLKAIMTGTMEEIKQAVQPVLDQGKNNMSPITWAVLLQKPEAVKTLLECGAKADSTIALFALNMKNINVILAIVKSGVDISSFADRYIELGVWNISKDNATSIDISATLELIQELIKQGYDVNKIWQKLPYHVPAITCIIDLLIKNGANPNHTFEKTKGSLTTPLINAVLNNMAWAKEHTIVIEALLHAGADINQQADPFSWISDSDKSPLKGLHTPLYFAINYSHTNAVAFLLEHSASL